MQERCLPEGHTLAPGHRVPVVTANARRAGTVGWPPGFLCVDSLSLCSEPKRQVLCSILILQVCKLRHRTGKHLAPNRRMAER